MHYLNMISGGVILPLLLLRMCFPFILLSIGNKNPRHFAISSNSIYQRKILSTNTSHFNDWVCKDCILKIGHSFLCIYTYIGKSHDLKIMQCWLGKFVAQLSRFCITTIVIWSSVTFQCGRVIWGLCCQKQVSQAGISNYISQFTVVCNYFSPAWDTCSWQQCPNIFAKWHAIELYIRVWSRSCFYIKTVFPDKSILVFTIGILISYIIHSYLSCAQNTDQ